MKLVIQSKLLLFAMAMGLVLACTSDHGVEPLPGRVKVTVYFRGTPPANTQGIYLIVAPTFPPHAINEMFHGSNSLPITQDTVQTEMVLPYGHYESLSLWWYSTETKSNLADVLAIPLDPKNDLMPLGFDISRAKPEVHIELYASWDRVNRDASVEGTVYFNGPFPKNTLATAVAAYRYKPVEKVHFLVYLKTIDFAINTNPYHFKLPVRQGSIDYVAVYWFPDQGSVADFHEIGFYRDPKNPELPGKLAPKTGQTITGVDIYADWSLVR
jgi:hypothetical protein